MTRCSLRLARSTRRLFTLASLVLLMAVGQGCKQEQAAPLPEKQAILDPVPVPAELVADVYIPNPDAAWGKARAAIGGPALFLPASTGALAATLFGLPLTVGSEIDGNVPIVGAVLDAPESGKSRVTIGLHLRAPDSFINHITKGENARHVTRMDEQTKITLIEPKAGGVGSAAMGVLGNYLIAAPTAEELLELGPYVVRNLPLAKMQTNDISIELPRAALEGPVATIIRKKWDGIKPRPLSNTQPASVPSPVQTLVDGVLGVLGDLDRARMTVDFDDQAAHVRFLGAPKMPIAEGSRIAAMTVGDPKKLLDLPGATDVALFVHDVANVRISDAQGYAKALSTAIGNDLQDDDRAAIEKALVAVAKSRGDTFAAGFSFSPTGPAVFVRSSVAQRDDLGRAIDDLLGLTQRKPIASWLDNLALGVTTEKTVLEDLKGDVRRIRIQKIAPKAEADKSPEKPAPGAKGVKPVETVKKKDAPVDKPPVASGTPSAIDVLYLFGANDLLFGAGYDAKAALRMVLDASPKDDLSTRPDMAKAIGALGGKAAFVVAANPMRLLTRQAESTTPAAGGPCVFALGKGGEGSGADEPWLRLDVANAVLQEIVKRRGAF